MTEIKTPFLNMQTDFVFKLVFGSEKNKPILIRFLNALFDGQLEIRDVTYHDKELIPSSKGGKTIVSDVYCTSKTPKAASSFFPMSQINDDNFEEENDHHFILEMQNIYIPPFEERLVYYLCKAVSEQGRSGWGYELQPVFTIAVTDFNFPYLQPKLVRDVVLADKDTKEAFTNKVHIFLCSLKEVPEKWEDCKTELEEILFLIKNMDKMDTTSTAYLEGRYTEVFEATRSKNLKEKDIVRYSDSLDKLRDIQHGIKFAVEQNKRKWQEEGFAEGRAEGKAEGKKETNIEVAKKMLALGLDIPMIVSITGLSVEELKNI